VKQFEKFKNYPLPPMSSDVHGGRCSSPQEKDLEVMREIFSLVDKDDGGTISSEELSELFSIVGIEAR